MKKQSLDTGGWFDLDRAKHFKASYDWNGSNQICRPTRDQWDHQALYITHKGRFVLNEWSQRQGSMERYLEIDVEEAANWLLQNDEADNLDGLPANLQKQIRELIDALEI